MFFDIGTFAEGEVRRRRHAMSIHGFLESELHFGHLGLEVFVKLRQVDGIFSSAVGGQILLGVNRKFQVVSFVGEERGHTSSLARGVVVGKLSQRKQLGPVDLLVVTVSTEILLEGLIDPFGLTIPFRMIFRSEVELHTKCCTEAAEEMRDEL